MNWRSLLLYTSSKATIVSVTFFKKFFKMKTVCVLALILCVILESRGLRTYKQGMPHPDQVVVFDDIITADGKIDFEYPEHGYKSKFLVTVVEVIDYKCLTALAGNGWKNFYGEFHMECTHEGNTMDSSVRIYGVYKGPCLEKKQVWDFELETRQKLPKPE